jgi:PPOX class probable F420-dependent enzyme
MASKRPTISAKVRAALKAARVGRLATLDAAKRPHLVPICFVFDGVVIYSAIDRKPKRVLPARLARLRNIAHTPQVALLVDHYEEDWKRLWFVLIRGTAKLMSDAEERRRAIRSLRAKYRQYDKAMLADDAPVLRITPREVISWGKI